VNISVAQSIHEDKSERHLNRSRAESSWNLHYCRMIPTAQSILFASTMEVDQFELVKTNLIQLQSDVLKQVHNTEYQDRQVCYQRLKIDSCQLILI